MMRRRRKEVSGSYFQTSRVGGLEEHERHGRPKQDDLGILVFGQKLSFEVSRQRKSWSGSFEQG